jgi:phage baseplate assembly protein W
VREQIEQVLFTNPGERVFRPEFGAGIRTLVFEPNTSPLWEITRKRLIGSLAEALRGEVDPRTLEVGVTGSGEKLLVVISYTLATLGHAERHEIPVGSEGGLHG